MTFVPIGLSVEEGRKPTFPRGVASKPEVEDAREKEAETELASSSPSFSLRDRLSCSWSERERACRALLSSHITIGGTKQGTDARNSQG